MKIFISNVFKLNKLVVFLLSIFFIFFLLNLSSANIKEKKAGISGEIPEEQKKPIDFKKEPVKYMADIYNDHHNWKVDDGIKKANEALNIVNKLYSKDSKTELKDPNLKLNKTYQVKSTLHTLLGMLYYRKSLLVEKEDRKKTFAPVLDKVKEKKELTDKDLEKVAKSAERRDYLKKRKKYFEMATLEFKAAIDSDPLNPVPHFQLGSMYSAASVAGQTEAAEKEFFLAAKLSLKESDKDSAERAIETLQSINPESEYLKKIEELMKERKNGK